MTKEVFWRLFKKAWAYLLLVIAVAIYALMIYSIPFFKMVMKILVFVVPFLLWGAMGWGVLYITRSFWLPPYKAISPYVVRFAKWLFALAKQKYISARENRVAMLEPPEAEPIPEPVIVREDFAPYLAQLQLIHAELHSDEKSL
jgi:hypothetical protein